MQAIYLEITIILLLIFANGIFSLSEMSVVSSRRALLEKLRREGRRGADQAVKLLDEPSTFLSTIQLGITLVGVFAAAFGGATLADEIAAQLEEMAHLKPYAGSIALFVVVIATTYLTLIIGELVPKRIALTRPENFACTVAPLMTFVSRIASPLVGLLSLSTDVVVGLLGLDGAARRTLSEREIKAFVDEGQRTGVFEKSEHDMLTGVFSLDQRKADTIMTPATELVWLDLDDSQDEIKKTVLEHPHSKFPVCRGGIDNLAGLVSARDLLSAWAKGDDRDVGAFVRKPPIVPDHRSALSILDDFRREKVSAAMVMDEYGAVRGLVTVGDVLRAIVGELPDSDEEEKWKIVDKGDGIYMIDGIMPVDELKRRFPELPLTSEELRKFHTVGGLIVHLLDRVPAEGETVQSGSLLLEVIDMDGYRVDKVQVTIVGQQA